MHGDILATPPEEKNGLHGNSVALNVAKRVLSWGAISGKPTPQISTNVTVKGLQVPTRAAKQKAEVVEMPQKLKAME